MKKQLANIATNEKQLLNGFRLFGLFPFYLKYITTGTHIQLCIIKEDIQKILGDEPIKTSDFYNSEIQKKAIPLIEDYIITALLNKRYFSWLFKPFIKRKVVRCGHIHLFNMYVTILKLDEPSFFLSYWKNLNQTDNTILKEEKPS